MGISIGCQGLSRVVDNLFVDFKGECVFNYLDDLVVYSDRYLNIRSILEKSCSGFGQRASH
jgi:hypothetical protein